jgi:hypothetical protein
VGTCGYQGKRKSQSIAPDVIHPIGISLNGRVLNSYFIERYDMDSVNKEWVNTCPRFVAFLDIMGFKNLIDRYSHEDVEKIMRDLVSMVDVIKFREKESLIDKPPDYTIQGIKAVTFSDSVILVSYDNTLESARSILYWVSWIIEYGLEQGIPLKGAIAYGNHTSDFGSSLHFGRPLIDAYQLQDELNFYGAILHHSFEEHLFNNNMISVFNNIDIISYPAPLKTGIIRHFVVNWISLAETEEIVLESLNKMYRRVSGHARLYVDNTIQYVNARHIINKSYIEPKSEPNKIKKE